MTHYGNYEEYLRHPMFKAARRAAFERAAGWCEACKSRPPVDAHHQDKKYPPWGAFDSPSNLIALCRECHCVAHNKEK
jgi:hypothetical protein